MRIQVLSDLHLETGPKEIAATNADVVVLAGDIGVGAAGLHWAREKFAGKPVVYVLGNHEFYHQSIPELTFELKKRCNNGHVHILENETFEFDGYTFLGCTLWTDFRIWPDPEGAMLLAGERMCDFTLVEMRRHKRLFRPWDSVKIFEKSVAWLHEEMRKHDPAKTIVVTHHAPSRLSIPAIHAGSALNAAFVSDLDEIIADSKVALWVHGHTHDNVDYRIARTRILSNQCGYAANKVLEGFDPGMVVRV